MAARSKALTVVISGDAKQLNRAFSTAGKDVDKFEKKSAGMSKRFVSSMKVAGAAAAGALVVGLKEATKAAVDVEESLSKNEVLFGKSAVAVDKFAKSAASSFGISRASALEATGTFGNLFTALGIGAAPAAKMSVSLTKLAGDLASFNNASPEEALEAIRSGLVGETEPLRKFGVNVNDAALRTEALRKGLVKTTKEALTPQQKALAIQGLLFKQTASAQGDFARTSGGLANKQRILKAQLSNVGVVVGQALIPQLQKAVKVLTRVVEWVQRNRTQAKALAIGFGVLAGAVGGLLIAAKVAVALKTLRGAILAVNVAMRAHPVIAVVTALGLLAGALVLAYKKSETFRKVVDGTFRAMKTIVGNAIAFVLRGFDKYLGGISSILSAASHLPGVGDKFRAAARGVDEARKKVRGVADEMDNLGKKKSPRINVKVRINYEELVKGQRRANAPAGAIGPGGLGDIPARVKDLAEKRGRSRAPRIASMLGGAFGGAKGGASSTGGKAGGLSSAGRAGMALVSRMFGGVRLTSGRRSPAQNAAIGGAPNSDHLTGNAIDLVPSEGWTGAGISRFDRIANWARKSGIVRFVGWRGLAGHGPGDHLHLSFLNRGSGGSRAGDPTDLVAFGGKIPGTGDVVSRDQMQIARQIVNVGRSLKAPPKVMLAAIEAGLVESNLRNLNYGDRDSVGVFQQRPSQGWKGLMNVGRAAREFITRAMRANGPGSAGQLAQSVQRSAFPGRYDERRGEALRILKAVGGARGEGGSARARARDAPSAAERAEAQSRAGSRIVNRIAGPFFKDTGPAIVNRRFTPGSKGITSLSKFAGVRDRVIGDKDTEYGQAERRFGQSDEDLGTAAGRGKRTSELAELKKLKQAQLKRRQARLAALNAQIGKYDGIIKGLRARLKSKKVKGATAARIRKRLGDFEDKRLELLAEARSLGSQITDTKLDIGDIDKESKEVAGTPNTDAGSGDSAASAADPADPAAAAASARDARLQPFRDAITGLNDDLIRAQVDTPDDKTDDIAVVTAQLAAATAAYNDAVARNDEEAIGEFGSSVLGLRGDLKSLQESMDTNTAALTAALEASLALQKEQLAVANRALAISQNETGTIGRVIADIVSGELGGRIGLGLASPGFAGGGSRY